MPEKNHIPSGHENGVHKTRIAITCFGEEIAPCFGTAHRFRFWEIVNNEAKEYRELAEEEIGGLLRVRLLRRNRVQVLICNGIEDRYREMLEAEGCQVVDGVIGSATDALFGYLAGRIKSNPRDETLMPGQVQPHTADLVIWTENLFRSLGWEIRRSTQASLLPVDLVAKRACPLCGKQVIAAICCGAHAYRINEEILELKRITATGYNVRVYVHHAVPGIERICSDFEIELLDPDDFIGSKKDPRRYGALPPLKGTVLGHEKLNFS